MNFYFTKIALIIGIIQPVNGIYQVNQSSYVHTSSQQTNINNRSSSSNMSVNFKPTISPGGIAGLPGMGGNPMASQQKSIEPPITTPASMHCQELGGPPPPQYQNQPQPIIVYVVQAPAPTSAVEGHQDKQY